jgi:flagellar basal-body rod protein FlgC
MSGIDRLFSGMRASSSGLAAERVRIDTVAKNIANANTTHTPEGGPYRRQVVHFAPLLERAAHGAREVKGVKVTSVGGDFTTPMERIFDPKHPDADAGGWVSMPNVNTTTEMVDLITATRSYEANMTAQEMFVSMAERALRLAQ